MLLKKWLLSVPVTLLLLSATAQQKMNTYQNSWKKIDSLVEKRGLTQSALTEVNKIYALARKEKNDPQVIKALVYRIGLQITKTEDPLQLALQDLEKEIAGTTAQPARSILQSIAAETYWNYFQQQRGRLYNRTETANFKKEDIATWSTDDLHKKISELYLASVADEKVLQQTKLEPFDAIITKGNVRYLRPTLFDLLAHRALEYFSNDERSITKPAYAFEIDQPEALADAKTFARYAFQTKDELSLYFKALRLYQSLIQFHLADTKPDALLDADIARLEFVQNHGVMPNKEELYKKTLESITTQYGQLPAAAQAWYLLANWHNQKAAAYDPLKDTTHRYGYRDALAICEKVIAQRDPSEGKANCQNLLRAIHTKNINLNTERVNVPNQPFRTLVEYRNFTTLHFRVVKITPKLRESFGTNSWEDEYWNKLVQLPSLKTFSRELPDTKDFQTHRAEINVDGLPAGEYALIASVNKDFKYVQDPMAVQFFYVSNIAWINKDRDYFVLHRETGAPFVRAAVQVWYRTYDYKANKYVQRKGENIMTDKNGHFHLVPSKTREENYHQLEITTDNDRLQVEDYTYNYIYQPENNQPERVHTFLFTDRSIYRPGQIVYLKGIVVKKDQQSKQNTIVTNLKTQVILYDANGQKVDSVTVTTNEYGSWSAKFTLPSNLLNGNFRIEDGTSKDAAYISVEEYKRPKFLTEIAKPAGTYRLNDEIEVTGTARAYAGNFIDGAQVKYRVVRKTVMPLWFFRYDAYFAPKIWPPNQSEGMEIAHGETSTDAKGNFKVKFKAIPDNAVPKKDQPTFHYEVSADVTDLNGETRSGNTSVAVAYQALRVAIDAPARLHADSLRNLKVSSKNLNDLFEKATVTLAIHKLTVPAKQFRQRYWQQPDQFVLTPNEYASLFPYDIYRNENEVTQWPREQKAWEKTDTTAANASFAMGDVRLPAGWYVIEATTTDKYGEAVKDVRYVQVYDKAIIDPGSFVSITTDKETVEPGATIKYTVNTNIDSAFVIQETGRKVDKLERSFFTLHKNSKGFELPVTETDRGGLGVEVVFIKHNRVYSATQQFGVPYTNKELSIAYETFRDKTLPGSQEKWKVKISGYRNSQVAAEMLATMYDASLDQFKPHAWQVPSLLEYFSMRNHWNGSVNFRDVQSTEKRADNEAWASFEKTYDRLLTNNGRYQYNLGGARLRGEMAYFNAPAPVAVADGAVQEKRALRSKAVAKDERLMLADGAAIEQEAEMSTGGEATTKPQDAPAAVVRKNFNETAFFFPDLKTDAAGNIEFSFTMPEALTQWKWMNLAHTKDLAFGYSTQNIITQKELMVQPNAPRFMREGDRMDFSGKIVNLTAKELTGQVSLQLIDPTTNQSVDGWFHNMIPNQHFTVAAGQSSAVSFTMEVPYQYNRPLTYRIVASSGQLSDGEEATLPVVSNRMLVTESIPLPMRGNATKNFTFKKLLESGKSETLNQHNLTVEFTSNPAWYAVQALPYLMEYPYECAEQVFNRYYANTLASTISNTTPGLKSVFEKWKTTDTTALLSNLQKNEELKSVLLQETPWVLDAKNEAQQKRNIGLLFDMVRMSKEQQSSLAKLQDMQSPNGGFVWFKGGPDDRYITQYIATGIGHLKKLRALPAQDQRLQRIVTQAIPYLDKKIQEDYDYLVKHKTKLTDNNLGYVQIQYLYMRSFFPEYGVPGTSVKAYNYYRKQAQQFWLKQSRYMQGMIALGLHRTGDLQTAKNIVASLKENALVSEEMGMYWKELGTGGYYWHQAPIESQSLLIETFTEVTKDNKAVEDLKTWLLKQKQTQNWRTTKATADACYALLLQGTNWLAQSPEVQIKLGDYTIRSTEQQQEAGTGYFKKVIDAKDVKPTMGNISVTVSAANQAAPSPSWGAVYWQYFENLDKITHAATPLNLRKQLFVEKNTDRGPVLEPLQEGASLKVGDKVKVRIELRVDRDLEYVHMKDMRAACMEPVNVISQFKWQGGLGYYETTKDASTNFFFGALRKGTWVFEYPLFVTHTGTFSNGVTTIQCMYAPEFTSHSEGVRVSVEK